MKSWAEFRDRRHGSKAVSHQRVMMWGKDKGEKYHEHFITKLPTFTEAHVLDREIMGSQQAWEDTAF